MTRLIADIPRKRRFRVGMIGGGKGAFFGSIHRAAMRLSDHFDIVAGAFSSDPENSRQSALALGVAPDRAYAHFAEMAKAEAVRPDRIEAVVIVTPNHLHFQP